MPVRKFRSLQEMEDSLWRPVGSPELLRAITAVWEFAERTCPLSFPPGVFRHRSVEEAGAQRPAWEEAHVRALREARAAGPER